MNKIFHFVSIVALLLSAACSSSKVIIEEPMRETSFECESTKEYVTALNYFREEKNLIASEQEARRMALEVSKGCDGAANRFIKVANLLLKSNVLGTDAAKAALKFSLRPNRDANTFVEVFTRCYLEEYLDMSIENSLRLASQLSDQFDGSSIIALDDFRKVLAYCLDNGDKFNLKKNECGEMAVRVAQSGQNSKMSVSKAFIDGFEFMNSSKGPNLGIVDALQVTEKLVAISPKSVSNFKDAYAFAVAKSGLGYGVKDAMIFSKNMAEFTGPENKAKSK